MKLGLDSLTAPDEKGKRHLVPMEAVSVGMDVLKKLAEHLQAHDFDCYMELLRVKFDIPRIVQGQLRAMRLIVCGVVSIRLFDLNADSRREVESNLEVNLLALKASFADVRDMYVSELVDELWKKLNDSISMTLDICRRKKLRFEMRHKVVEPQ